MEKRSTLSPLYSLLIFGALMAIWVVFSGFLDPFHLSLGLISCGIVTWLSSDLLFDDRTIPLRRRAVQTWRFTQYTVWLTWQIVLANIAVFKLAFGPRSALQPQIVRYRTPLKSDFEKFLLANSITLTPGTVTIKILGDTFYIHAIDDASAAGLNGEMDRRIARIFEDPAHDLRAFRDRSGHRPPPPHDPGDVPHREGPTALDRIVAVNVIGTKTAVFLVVIGVVFKQVGMFVDFALAYALLNFTGSIAAARYLHRAKQRGPEETGAEPTHGKEAV